MFDYEIKIAQTPEEIKAAQKLRFEIFNLEKSRFEYNKPHEGFESDKFDKYCDHLIVIDKSINKMVGTYRLLLGSRTDKSIGFHSEEIFNIDDIKKNGSGLLELGRSCVHKDYRNNAVINLLWDGIAAYVTQNRVKYLFGCARLDTSEPKEVSEAFALIKEKYYNRDFEVKPRKENIFEGLDRNLKIENPRQSFRKLSPLIKGYLNLGARICGEPAINREFGSVVFFVLLEMDKIKKSYKDHFLNLYPENK